MQKIDCHTEFVMVSDRNPDDVASFLTLGRAYNEEIDLLMGTKTPRPAAERWLNSMVQLQEGEDRWLVLCRVGGADIGFAHAKIDQDDRPGWGYILEFYIIPDRRRSGWGRQLFHYIKHLLIERGTGQIWLTSNLAAVAFWEVLGFTATGEVESNGLPVMAMK